MRITVEAHDCDRVGQCSPMDLLVFPLPDGFAPMRQSQHRGSCSATCATVHINRCCMDALFKSRPALLLVPAAGCWGCMASERAIPKFSCSWGCMNSVRAISKFNSSWGCMSSERAISEFNSSWGCMSSVHAITVPTSS
eukprot:138804-Pelagomonas_calceolata.AAC.2